MSDDTAPPPERHRRSDVPGVPRRAPVAPADVGPTPDGWVRMDFHTHTYGSGDAVTTVDEFGEGVERAGLDVVCITDHHAVHVAQALTSELGVRVIVGSEVKTHDGELIGLFLHHRVSFGVPSAECAIAIRGQGGLVYVPHPVGPRAHAMSAAAVTQLAADGLLDAVEVFNARNPTDLHNEVAQRLADELDLPGGVGSDAHNGDELGACWLELPDFDSPADLLAAMRQGRAVGARHPGGRSAWRPRIVPPSA